MKQTEEHLIRKLLVTFLQLLFAKMLKQRLEVKAKLAKFEMSDLTKTLMIKIANGNPTPKFFVPRLF